MFSRFDTFDVEVKTLLFFTAEAAFNNLYKQLRSL